MCVNESISQEGYVRFGKYVRNRREELGLTQNEVAEYIGTTQVYLTYLESGRKSSPVDVVVAHRLCEILKLNLDDFVKEYLKK
jgi:transcriptional regulator with XRE-family HTH domain